MKTLFTCILYTCLVLQCSAGTPAIIGDIGRRLTETEVASISNYVPTNTAPPWLLVLLRGQVGAEFVYVYTAPTIETSEIRRGTRVLLSRGLPDRKTPWDKWKVNGKGWYAQVAVPGRDLAVVTGDRDINQPFGVGSAFSDEDLVSLAKLIRSSPTWSAVSGASEQVQGDWPIDSVERDRKGVVVIKTRKDNSSGQVVKLDKSRDQWRIIGIGFWMH